MTFGQPHWFWAFALLPVLVALFVRNERSRMKLLRQLVAARLEQRLAGTVSLAKRRLRFALLLLGMACVIASLAQPRLGSTWEQSQRKGRDVLVAIDVSKSMLATDLTPNRLTRAKFAAQDLISQLGGDRVGLIAFAGSAFLQAPLTADFGAVLTSLNELDTEIIPRGGTNIAEAIRVAVEAFGKGESDHRALVIMTDGEELDADGIKAAENLHGAAKIFGVGVGSAEGSLIPLPGRESGDFVKDDRGQIVKSRLDEERLRKIAELTGGFYVHLQSGPTEMTRIVREGLSKMSEQDIDAKLSRQPIERYQWPLGAGLILLAGSMLVRERRRDAERWANRGAAIVSAMTALAFAPADAAGSPSESYAQGKYAEAQQAWQRLAEKNAASGALAFNWGAAAYKNQDYDSALKAFSQALTTDDPKLRPKAEYNLGNTLFQRGSAKQDRQTLEDALGHYEQALKLAPTDANAQHNKKVTEELIAKLKEKEKEKKQEEKKDQKKEQKEQQKGEPKDQQDQKNEKKEEKASPDDQPKPNDEPPQKQEPGDEEKKEQPQPEPQDSKEKNEEKDGTGESQKGDKGGEPKQQQAAADAEQPEKKPSGEVKANPSQPQEQKEMREEATAEELADAERKMQARALLESLKSEDDRVRLVDPSERKRARGVVRDW